MVLMAMAAGLLTVVAIQGRGHPVVARREGLLCCGWDLQWHLQMKPCLAMPGYKQALAAVCSLYWDASLPRRALLSTGCAPTFPGKGSMMWSRLAHAGSLW